MNANDRPDGTIGVLASGGLDSAILVGHLLEKGRRVQPFYIATGLAWQAAELAGLRAFLAALRPEARSVNEGITDRTLADASGHQLADVLHKPEAPAKQTALSPAATAQSHKPEAPAKQTALPAPATGQLLPLVVLDLPLADLYGPHWSVTGEEVPDGNSPDEAVYLPGRNALLLVKAAIWCQLHGIGQLALAPLGTSPFDDASPAFFRDFQAAINRGSPRPLRLLLPFSEANKREVMRLGRDLPLELTFSCIDPVAGVHCGRCNKCAERRAAFADAGLVDRTVYHCGL